MSQIPSKVSEFLRFPFWGTLFGGIFLLLIIRIYWDPSLATRINRNDKKEIWLNQQYAVWGPIWKYGFDRMGKGEIPHWNPYQLCGQPYLVDIRTALFQPLHLLFWRMDFAHAYQWYIFLSLSLLGIAFLIWGRIVEIPYSALIPGLVSLLFSGPVICAQMSLPLLSGSVWLLFLLGGIVYFVESQTFRSFLIVLFIWTSLLLSGSIECILTGTLLIILFPFVFQNFPSFSKRKKSLPLVFKITGILVLGITISAFAWFPFLMWQIYSREGLEQFTSFPLSAHFPETFYMSLSHLLLPVVGGDLFELPVLYPGLICLMFIIPALFERELRSVVLFHGFIILLFFSLFFLKLDLARILQKGMLTLVATSFSILSGIGFYRLLLKGRDLSSPYVWVSGILVFLMASILIIVGNTWIKGVSILLIVLLVPAIIIRIPRINSFFCILIALLGFVELYYMLRPFLPESYIPIIERQDTFSEFARQLRYQTGTGRALIVSEPNTILWSENLGMYYHWQLINGTSLPRDRYSQLWMDSILTRIKEKSELLSNPLVTMSGVQWVLIPNIQKGSTDEKNLKIWRKMEPIPFVEIYENTQPTSRCFWVGNYIKVSSLEEVINTVLQNKFSPSKECIVLSDAPAPFISQTSNLIGTTDTSDDTGTATVQEETPEYISIQVKASREGFLVLLDTYIPGWKAFIDGEQTQIYRTNGIFRGILTPGGVHQVTFQYTTPGWDMGRGISFFSILFLFSFLIIKNFFNLKKTV